MNKPFVYTYSNIACYLNCPAQFRERYWLKSTKFVETPEMAWGNKVHSAFEYRVGGGKPLPPDMNHWEPFAAALDGMGAQTEMKLGITRAGRPCGFFDNDVFFRGKIDVVVVKGTTAFLPDWKTGKKREHPFELECQALLLHARLPNLTKIYGSYVWLKDNQMGTHHDLSDTNSTWAYLNNKVDEIESCMQHDTWERNRTPLCGYCDVLSCPNNPKGT